MLTFPSPSRKTMTKVSVLTFFGTLARMKADEFCERWFSLDQLDSSERESAKEAYGYRTKCVSLLARILNKPEKTVSNWGPGFVNMPKDYEMTLAYADAIRQQFQSAPEELLRLYLEKLN